MIGQDMSMNKGIAFEKQIAQLYRDLGKTCVEHNIHLINKSIHSQFDLSYGAKKRYFIECKYRSSGVVGLSEVATFAAKLSLHNIPYRRGIVITNTTYDARSIVYAKKMGLQLINGKQLRAKQRSPYRFIRSLL